MILADGEQTSEFTLRTGIGLQRNPCEPGDFRKPVFELLANLSVTQRLITGRERMQFGDLGPRDREHFRGGVQFHCARAEWNHRSRQRQIARFQFLEITQHFRLGVVRIENRMSEERGIADCELRNADWRLT